MASLSQSKTTGIWRILFTDLNGQRRAIQFGRMSEKRAEAIKAHVEELIQSAASGSTLDGGTASWANGEGRKKCPARMRRQLVKLGLIAPGPGDVPAPAAAPTVAAFIDGYLADRKDVLKERTMNGAGQDQDSLLKFLGADRALDAVTPGDADDFVVWLRREDFAEATIGRRVRRCSQFFRAAVRKRLIADNPFAGVEAPSQENESRFYFVTRAETERLLEACPNAQWRLIVALSRYGGLRCPSETLALTWGDVDWERNRIRVPSPKTERYKGKASREIPLFPELLRPLLEASELREDGGSPFVITRGRDSERDGGPNLRTQMLRILKRAGLTPWERVFHNMRASRQNELAAEYPIHVVCRWIGNSALIANKHYLSGTDDYFAAAAGSNAQCHADGPGMNRLETTGADTPLEMSAPGKSSPLRDLKSYPQGESNPCPLAENQIS